MSSTINRLALVAGSVLAGGILGVLAMSTAAHADDKPAQHPGGVLGTVEAVVDQVAPEPTKPAEPPVEPEPEHSEEPAAEPEPTEPAEQAPAEAPVEVPPVVITTPPAPPVVVTPPPVVIVTPPVVAPTPTPTPTRAPEQPTVPLPVQLPVDLDEPADEVDAPLPAEPVAAPIDLPVLIGPLPGRTLDDGIRPAEPAALPEVPICDDPDRDPAQPRGDEKQHRRIHTTPTAAADKPRPARPCPNTPGNPGQAINTLSVKPPPPTGEQLVADSAAGTYSRPVLHRLTQMRARSHTLAGRTEHPEPGPA